MSIVMRKLVLGVATLTYSREVIIFWIGMDPRQRAVTCNPTVSALASNMLNMEVQGLLEKGTICMVGRVPGQYVSSPFTVPKSKRWPNKWIPILNIKKFN